MDGGLIQFAASLAAAALLVAGVHLAGFNRSARLLDEAEARELAGLTPGGFAAERVVLDQDGGGAVLADKAGRMLLLRAHGGRFVPELVPTGALAADGELLIIRIGARAFTLHIGQDAAQWAAGGQTA